MNVSTKATVLFLRFGLGAVLFAHGLLKLGVLKGGAEDLQNSLDAAHAIGNPDVFRYAVTTIEAGGGLLLLLGMLGRVAALAAAALMAFRVFLANSPYFFAKDGGFEVPLVLLAVALSLVFLGSGSVSVDGLFADWRRKGRELRGGPEPGPAARKPGPGPSAGSPSTQDPASPGMPFAE